MHQVCEHKFTNHNSAWVQFIESLVGTHEKNILSPNELNAVKELQDTSPRNARESMQFCLRLKKLIFIFFA